MSDPIITPTPAPGSPVAPGSASITVPPTPAPGAAPITPPPAGAFTIPEAFKDKPYLKGVDSQEKLFSMLDGAQTLIGKKGPAIPAADAKPEEWNAFYDALGRPKDAKEYKFPTADKTEPALLTGISQAMHKHGLTQKQAEGVWTDVEATMGAFLKEKGVAAEKENVDFTKLATDVFGPERDKTLALGKEMIAAYASPAVKPYMNSLSNEHLVLIADVLNNINKKYIKQDGAPRPPSGGQGGTPDELRNKARLLMSEQSKHNSMSVEFANYQKQIDAIYESLRQSGIKV